ncbi:S-protein homolog 5-like [Cicer arietinum]|uniref:S-protein homolog 5-like n=1 Tax=Cicer arietinum TaxID=3827 RepID=UPI003CC5F82A
MHNDVLGNIVRMTNKLENGMALAVHCKSGDDDLGPFVLQYDQTYGFSFQNGFFVRTQFYCSFTSNGDIKWFDIYIAGRDLCETCNWIIKQEGPCRLGKYAACYPWNKKLIM